MDFEDSGIQTETQVNSENKALKQPVQPIISFSPERCRFDSAQSSSSRKASIISVEDLQQLDHHPPSLNNHLPLSKPTNNGLPIQTTSVSPATPQQQHPNNLLLNDHQNRTVIQPCSLFTNNVHTSNQQLLKHTPTPPLHPVQQSPQSYPFLHTSASTTSSSTFPAAATASVLQGPGLVISANTLSTSASSSSSVPHPISLMVNGAVLSASLPATTTTTTTSSTSSTSNNTSLDLQKRLEKRIAQASAIAAATAATSSSSISSPATTTTTTASSSITTSSTLLSSSSSCSTTETKADSSILSEIIGIANKAISSSSSGATLTEKPNGNQISFSSPEKPSLFTAASQQLDLESISAEQISTAAAIVAASFNQSSSAIDLWENKVVPSSSNALQTNFRGKESVAAGEPEIDSFIITSTTNIAAASGSGINEIIIDSSAGKTAVVGTRSAAGDDTNEHCISPEFDAFSGNLATGESTTTTTSCNTSSSVNTVTSSSNCSKNNKPKGNQSLRNNNSVAAPPTSSSSGGAGTGVGTGLSASSSSNQQPSVITVVNASFDIRKVSALLPPQRLAIPNKSSGSGSTPSAKPRTSSLSSSSNPATFSYGSSSTSKNNNDTKSNPPATSTSTATPTPVPTVHKTSSSKHASISETSCGGGVVTTQPALSLSSGNGNIKTGNSNSSKLSGDLEKKPLVQWDSDESEEELSFFPPAKRGVITDNLSIDNMSLSGEEEDLHLTPPRPLAKKCPCDPRNWLDRTELVSSGHGHHGHHHHSTRNMSSKFSCVIS